MSDCSENINPLQHNGTSQSQRLLPGLDRTRFALADEKDYADWIVFAQEFAKYLKYYNTDHVFTRDWQVFFSSDISARLGMVAIQDIGRYRTEIKERLDFIRDDDNNNSLEAVFLKLNELFSAILTLSKALDNTQLQLPKETKLKTSLLNLIQTKLAPALNKFIAWHKAAENLGYLNHSYLSPWKILNQTLTDAGVIMSSEGLSSNWYHNSGQSNWFDYLNSIAAEDGIFQNPVKGISNTYPNIEHAANHNLFTGIFDIYLSSYTRIINEAESELLGTLDHYSNHLPHYALFLSFLKLFRFSRDHINTLTQRHLDFYYKEVLKLQPKPAVANQVHILAELARHVDEYLLSAGTVLKAGKDSNNKEVIYTLDAETVFNKAKVAQMKSFYKGNSKDHLFYPDTAVVKQNNEGRVFASPVVNSDDGLGAKLTGENQEWHPYIHKVYKESVLESIPMPMARLGFAIASHYLYLTEGERKVTLRLVTNPLKVFDKSKIECWLTAEKEWYQVEEALLFCEESELTDSTPCLELSFTIPGTAPAIGNYNAAVHSGTFDCDLPILKIILKNEETSGYEYDSYKEIKVTDAEIRVEVGTGSGTFSQTGLKNLLISNDAGPLDASKPFLPFGSQPRKDAGLVIGHKEIFSKKNANVKLNLEWAEISDFNLADISYSSKPGNYPNVSVSLLSAGIWNQKNSLTEIFNGNSTQVTVDLSQFVIGEAVTGYDQEYKVPGPSTTSGFLRLSLNDGFGYQDYIHAMSLYLIGQSKNPKEGTKPNEPYVPKIKSLYASYSASAAIKLTDDSTFNSREIRFFHLYPFGEGEQHSSLQTGTEVYLLPQFQHDEGGSPQHHSGELYLGLENLEPGQAVNILFQVLEGTTDPTLVKPDPHLHWSYLGNNVWIPFETAEYSDRTFELVKSGIISFAVPQGATIANTILPSGFLWFRAAVTEAAESVCKLISVDAQAAVATFSDQDNAEDFLDVPLAADTISKLKIPDASVKKLSQPYSSFGGRQKENDDHFYIRVSERLRHKARAITVWDYEHLVLEAFPEIYKVKCLNHTRVDEGIYDEVSPGYVSIITIPSLQTRNEVNPLKPYAQQSTLDEIACYLGARTSAFVKLKVCQPRFEEIRLEFKLKLHSTYKDFNFYAAKLQDEITRFLSPWAYGNQSSLDFGGKVYKSVLINFIEERYYVEYITDVFMYVKADDTTPESTDQDEIIATTARSILVSAPASRHKIHEIIETTVSTSASCP